MSSRHVILVVTMALVIGAVFPVSAEILYEQNFDTPATQENFFDIYSELQVLNELEIWPGFSMPSGEANHEVIDGALKYGVHPHPTFAGGIGWAELSTKQKFKPAEGNKIRFSARIRSKGNPGNYSIGITAWDLQLDVPPGFHFNDFLCNRHYPGDEECVTRGGVSMHLVERQRDRVAMFELSEQASTLAHSGAAREPVTAVHIEQGKWFTMAAEWDGGSNWDFMLEGTRGETWSGRYNRQFDDPIGLLPIPDDDGIRFGVSVQQNPPGSASRGYCGVGGMFSWLPSFGYGDGICENWIDDLKIEEISLLLLGDIDDDGSINNLDITPFIAALAAADEAAFLTQFPNGNYAAADVDMSGSANNLDITPFIGLLTAAGSNATVVPEPSSLVCIALALMMGRRRAVRW